jgi:glycosyltransferase involved in cell wall biosynthesis
LKTAFSVIVPVYNRPDELMELLDSLVLQTTDRSFEVIVVDDGSEPRLEPVVNTYTDRLDIRYYYYSNRGPGMSRNLGMQKAKGNYFIFFDSDCVLPDNYFETVYRELEKDPVDAFGGPDAAHSSFSTIQKAINYSMTSMLTTGGLRTGASLGHRYQLRSYNMGISRKAYEATGGFSDRRTGEDIDLTFRLWNAGMSSRCIPTARVFHKRRTSLEGFYAQTYSFGKARPALNRKYPGTGRLTYWFPSVFLVGLLLAVMFSLFGWMLPVYLYLAYLGLVVLDASIQNRDLGVGLYALLTTLTQFTGYGIGFIKGSVQSWL